MAKTTTSKTRKRRIPRKRKPQTTGLAPLDCRTELTDDLRPVGDRVKQEGGAVKQLLTELGAKPEDVKRILETAERNSKKAPAHLVGKAQQVLQPTPRSRRPPGTRSAAPLTPLR